MTDASKIKNLLRLGIDVWVPRNRQNTNEKNVGAIEKASLAAIPETTDESPVVPITTRNEVTPLQPHVVDKQTTSAPKPSYKPSAIHLNSYQSSNALVVTERGVDAPKSMIRGILTALHMNSDPSLREVKFDFPPTGLGERLFESESQFIQQAVNAIEVFLQVQNPAIKHLLIIGMADKGISTSVKLKEGRVFAVEHFPSSAQQKKLLWENLKANRNNE